MIKAVGKTLYEKNKRKTYSNPYFESVDHSQYLMVRIVNIGGGLVFKDFDVCYANERKDSTIKNKTRFTSFVTDRNIHLGMSETDFIQQSRNLPYEIISNYDGYKLYTYNSTTIVNSTVNYYPYSSRYFFKDDKLVRFMFGVTNYTPL